ncbi:hypothetical protein NPX13_g570 [Xylaria arbuscula]|uniref:Uncharacterized protein n=1 Tax=Xylaria arbuscula TaxID=114810 RepID=A0A9W8NML8_9PEZI|nr:hypothetical protein NPX13_g570 [Xylaria arbuscula]
MGNRRAYTPGVTEGYLESADGEEQAREIYSGLTIGLTDTEFGHFIKIIPGLQKCLDLGLAPTPEQQPVGFLFPTGWAAYSFTSSSVLPMDRVPAPAFDFTLPIVFTTTFTFGRSNIPSRKSSALEI